MVSSVEHEHRGRVWDSRCGKWNNIYAKKITKLTSKSKIKEIECEKERQGGTQCNSFIPKVTIQEWHYQQHYELGFKASHILTGLGQLPFDIFTLLSWTYSIQKDNVNMANIHPYSTLPHNGPIQQRICIKEWTKIKNSRFSKTSSFVRISNIREQKAGLAKAGRAKAESIGPNGNSDWRAWSRVGYAGHVGVQRPLVAGAIWQAQARQDWCIDLGTHASEGGHIYKVFYRHDSIQQLQQRDKCWSPVEEDRVHVREQECRK